MVLNERLLETALLSELVREKVPVTVFLVNGAAYQGVITACDVLVLVLAAEGTQRIIYKNSVSSIAPQKLLQTARPKCK